jgi:hypothetical protein
MNNERYLFPVEKFTLGYTGVDSRPHGMGRNEYADCIVCGESHYVRENDRGYKELVVNGHVVTRCINCAYRKDGIILW